MSVEIKLEEPKTTVPSVSSTISSFFYSPAPSAIFISSFDSNAAPRTRNTGQPNNNMNPRLSPMPYIHDIPSLSDTDSDCEQEFTDSENDSDNDRASNSPR